MIELTSTTVTKGNDLIYDPKTIMYPFKLQALDKKRMLYAFKSVEREMWMQALSSALGYVKIQEVYNIIVNALSIIKIETNWKRRIWRSLACGKHRNKSTRSS